ncbi:putative isoflavone reductase like protein [Rhexocercosporidium sp. MPI-PUGE-AT-0058]|nr:putative isoflavone reductase like protein [Rhexocercosporidium sp. MPI-PUGE-AT-0058]
MAQPKKENLLILGGTGYIGSYILDQIVKAKDSFGHIAIFTSPKTAESKAELLDGLRAKGVGVIVGNVQKPEDLLKAFQGVDTVISAVGRMAIGEQVEWIKLAEQAPTVKRFFPSEYGTDIEYGPESANEVPHQQKLKVRAALKETSGLEYTYIVTGPYADVGGYLGTAPYAPEIGCFNVKEKKAVLIGDGKGKVSLTTPDDVGRLVVKALLHPEASRNRALKVNSFTTTPAEIVAEFEKQTGDKWSISYTTPEKVRELEKDAYANKHPAATVFTLKRIWGEGGTLYEKRDNYLIDAEDTETLEVAIRTTIAAQLAS